MSIFHNTILLFLVLKYRLQGVDDVKNNIVPQSLINHCYSVGEVIIHNKFGEGTIQSIHLDSLSICHYNKEDYLIEVFFKDFGLKILSLNLCIENSLLLKTSIKKNIMQVAS